MTEAESNARMGFAYIGGGSSRGKNQRIATVIA
jgi:hypothetical protein